MKIVVIIPVGPGHWALAEKAADSVRAAWLCTAGPFDHMLIYPVHDLEGKKGRSCARNLGMVLNPEADYFFFLDADDRMMPEAFGLIDLNASATFGAVCIRRSKVCRIAVENKYPITREDLFIFGAKGTLSMGMFVRADLYLRFNEALDVGEDFDFYMRLPDFTKVAEPLVSIGRTEVKATGTRSTKGVKWQQVCGEIIQRFAAEEGI